MSNTADGDGQAALPARHVTGAAMRFFNIAGPVECERHYCLDPLGRFGLQKIELLIAQQKYFVLHAPRQTGKTSSMLALMRYLNQGDDYRCLYVNVEAAQAARGNVEQGMHDKY